MSLIGGILTGVNKVGGAALDAVNSGTCGKKCFGIGGGLKRCRRAREADCAREEAERQRIKNEAILDEERYLAGKESQNGVQAAGFSFGSGGGVNTIILIVMVIFGLSLLGGFRQ